MGSTSKLLEHGSKESVVSTHVKFECKTKHFRVKMAIFRNFLSDVDACDGTPLNVVNMLDVDPLRHPPKYWNIFEIDCLPRCWKNMWNILGQPYRQQIRAV